MSSTIPGSEDRFYLQWLWGLPSGEPRRIRQQAGYGAEGFARLCGVHFGSLLSWERGTTRPQPDSQLAWAKGLYRAYRGHDLDWHRTVQEALTDLSALEIGSPLLDLPERALNCLRRTKINTVADLVERTPADLLAISNLGVVSLKAIETTLAELGLSLKHDEDAE